MQGVIIMDTDRRIRVMSSGAENLLGWRQEQVAGLACSLVLNCQGADGQPLCGKCRSAQALASGEVTPFGDVWPAGPSGERHLLSASFWYLPPTGAIYEPRLMMVLSAELRKASPHSSEAQSARAVC
jgi:PAS domain-containing protein